MKNFVGISLDSENINGEHGYNTVTTDTHKVTNSKFKWVEVAKYVPGRYFIYFLQQLTEYNLL